MIEYKFHDPLTEIPFEKKFSESESKILKQGIKAGSMDEKWDVFFEKNTLNFYRSWTGIGIFKIEFREEENKLIVEKAYADEESVRHTSPEYSSLLLNWIIEILFFKREVPFPRFEE